MTISLASIARAVSAPPRIIVYGVPGIGKSTFAAMAPSPVFIPIEDGVGDLADPEGNPLNVPAFPRPTSFEDVMDSAAALLDGGHDYGTLVIDSLDALEPLVWDYVCRRDGKESIEAYGYGKGYVAAAGEFRRLFALLDQVRDTGMLIVATAHSTVARVEPPETDAFDRYQLRLHKSAEAFSVDWADAVLFANYKVAAVTSGPKGSERRRGVSDGTRILHTTERAAWRAKNRYRMPDQLPFDWAEVAKYLPQPSAAPAGE